MPDSPEHVPVIAVASGKGLIDATTPLFPPAPEQDSIWGLVPRLASIPFSYQAALDADEGRPVMITGAVPEQVAAYQLIAAQLTARLTSL